MNETIRQHIKRRVRWCMAIAAGGWLMFPLATSLAGYLPEGIPQGAAPLAGMLLFVGAIFTMQRIVKCPKCKARLAQTIAMHVAFSWGSGPRVNFCPYCGVSLDERAPRSEPVAPTQDPIRPA